MHAQGSRPRTGSGVVLLPNQQPDSVQATPVALMNGHPRSQGPMSSQKCSRAEEGCYTGHSKYTVALSSLANVGQKVVEALQA